MKIAYITYEYPQKTSIGMGGIATYVYQVANLMNGRGHVVEVFCASPDKNISEQVNGVLIHRVHCKDNGLFPQQILSIFSARHEMIVFDIIESPEFAADGWGIQQHFPKLPMVVKLHTPLFLVNQLNKHHTLFKTKYIVDTKNKLRYILGGIKRGKIGKPYWKYYKENDKEYKLTQLATEIHTPSVSLGDIVSQKWGIARQQIFNVPNPYIPSIELLNINSKTSTNRITFIGRLEMRKGIINLIKAIPSVLKKHPHLQFRFVGKSMVSKEYGDMKEYICKQLKFYKSNIEFLQVSPVQIPQILMETDICVFPSIWENFPNVCLEAMSAARGIVASNKGGMKDMLEPTQAGILIDPSNVNEIIVAINKLIENDELRIKFGVAARLRVLDAYNGNVIGDMMEKRYSETIKKANGKYSSI